MLRQTSASPNSVSRSQSPLSRRLGTRPQCVYTAMIRNAVGIPKHAYLSYSPPLDHEHSPCHPLQTEEHAACVTVMLRYLANTVMLMSLLISASSSNYQHMNLLISNLVVMAKPTSGLLVSGFIRSSLPLKVNPPFHSRPKD